MTAAPAAGLPAWVRSRSRGAALALAAAVFLAACQTTSGPTGGGSQAAAGPANAHPTVTLVEATRPRLSMSLSLDGNDLPRPGHLEFKDLGCGGTYRYLQRDSAGHLVLQMEMRPGRCLKGCQLIVSPDFRSYTEVCNGRRVLSGTFGPIANLDDARDPADIARREAARQQELAAIRAEAEQATTPAQIERLRRKLANRDERTGLVLDARLNEFLARERQALQAMSLAELRSFIADRSPASEDASRAASEPGLKLAAETLQSRYLQAASSAPVAELEGLLKNTDAGPAARQAMAARLAAHYQQQKAFMPLFRLYELTTELSHLKAGAPFARSAEELSLLEAAAVKTLRTPGWLFDAQPSVTLGKPSSRVAENMGLFANFTANVAIPISAEVTVKPRSGGPLKLSRNRYQVTVTAELTVPRVEQLRSNVLGNRDRFENVTRTASAQVTVGPPTYEARASVSLGSVNLGYFQSGSQGGYTATYPSDEGRVVVKVTSITPVP